MFDHYSINVARQEGTYMDGHPRFIHLFATAPGSCRDRDHADDVLANLRARFPEADGFKITMTHWVCRGEQVPA